MTYQITQWADAEDGWDTETGNPGIMLTANAIQAWSTFQQRETTVAEAAQVFNLDPKDVRAAVEAHPWMFLGGDTDDETATIEHEGD